MKRKVVLKALKKLKAEMYDIYKKYNEELELQEPQADLKAMSAMIGKVWDTIYWFQTPQEKEKEAKKY